MPIASLSRKRSLLQRAKGALLSTGRKFTSRSKIIMMPEGPEVKTLVDQLAPSIGMKFQGISFQSGRYVEHGPPEHYRAFMDSVQQQEEENGNNGNGNSIEEWNAKGKFIYITLKENNSTAENGDDYQRSIWITLGMSGRFISQSLNDQQRTKPRWYLKLRDSQSNMPSQIFYHDPRNFGTLKFSFSRRALQEKLDSLGPDILKTDTTTVETFCNLIASLRNPKTNVCKFLMNQGKISGIGNYILAEGLYRANIDPYCGLDELSQEQKEALFSALQTVALESYKAQGMTRATYRTVEGERGQYEYQLQCYGRSTCARGNRVLKDTNGPHGRTIHFVQDQLFMPLDKRRQRLEQEKQQGKRKTTAEAKRTTTIKAKSTSPKAATFAASNDETRENGNDDVVQSLLQHLHEEGWKRVLSETTQSQAFVDLAHFVEREREQYTIFPPKHSVFEALNLCPFDKVKVVIVGQDPYHGRGQGHGLAFSVQPGVRLPPSLQNIFKQVHQDMETKQEHRQFQNGSLVSWAQQGVLLLNTVLTVREGRANSHKNKAGWEGFTDAIIHELNTKKEGLVFLLWGNPAHEKAKCVDESKHVVIRTSHPSPLGATKTKSPFLGSQCFLRANEALVAANQDAIDWNLSKQ